MRVFLISAALFALTAATALAALNPPPPSFETCKAVGNGTICEGMVSNESIGPLDTGIACGTFDVIDTYMHDEVAKRTYDADGNLVTRVRHDRDRGTLSRPGSPAALTYTSTMESTDQLAVPGDFRSTTLTVTGSFVLRSPADALLLLGAGRVVYAPDGTIHESGPSGFVDLIFNDPATLASICSALS